MVYSKQIFTLSCLFFVINRGRIPSLSVDALSIVPRNRQSSYSQRFATNDDASSTPSSSIEAATLRPGSLEAATKELGRVPYGESSRKFRRTVYTHDDWLVHRSNDRLFNNLISMFFSGIVRQVKNKIFLLSSVATFVIVWNDIVVPSYHPEWSHLVLPVLPFSLSSPALGLLLVFRTNTSYQRWLEARQKWGVIVSQSKNILRMASTFTDHSENGATQKVERLGIYAWAVARTIMFQLAGDREDRLEYEQQLKAVLEDDPDFVEQLLSDDDPVAIALMEASLALDDIAVDEKRRVETDKSLVILGDTWSACDRIFRSPVPLVYTRHTARFLSLWMLLLPFGIHDEFVKADVSGLPTLPATAILSLFLFGIEELAVQLEEPFSILPMQKFCDEIQASSRIIQWSAKRQR